MLLRGALQHLRLIGAPLAVSLALTTITWLLLGQPVPEPWIPAIALLVTPHLWLGLLLAVLLGRYNAAARRLATATTSEEAARRALRVLHRAYAFREWLGRSHLRNAVYLGYLVKFHHLDPRVTGHPLNAYDAVLAEQSQERIRLAEAFLAQICEFVYACSGVPGTRPARVVLDELVERIPDDVGKKVLADVVRSTFEDGPGFLSTLTALTYVHFLLALPPRAAREVAAVLEGLRFTPAALGWLSNRVVEAAVHLYVNARLTPASVVAAVQPVLDDVEKRLAEVGEDGAMSEKWRGRNRLRSIAGIA